MHNARLRTEWALEVYLTDSVPRHLCLIADSTRNEPWLQERVTSMVDNEQVTCNSVNTKIKLNTEYSFELSVDALQHNMAIYGQHHKKTTCAWNIMLPVSFSGE